MRKTCMLSSRLLNTRTSIDKLCRPFLLAFRLPSARRSGHAVVNKSLAEPYSCSQSAIHPSTPRSTLRTQTSLSYVRADLRSLYSNIVYLDILVQLVTLMSSFVTFVTPSQTALSLQRCTCWRNTLCHL